MSDFIVGQDISYAQGIIDWNTYKNNTNFVIIQSSYGNGYFDSQYGNNKGQVLQTNLPHGYYHFAYPDLNAPEDEANWFLHALSAIKPLQAGELLFLDYERHVVKGSAITDVEWVKRFLDTVSNALGGYKPLLYTYQDMLTGKDLDDRVNDFTPVTNEGYGLWIAAPTNDPTNNNFQTGAFPFAAIQQWGTQNVPGISGVVDADVFFGTATAFTAYGYKPTSTPLPPSTTSAPAQPVQEPQVNPTPTTIPIEVTTTGSNPVVPISTDGTSSANPSENNENPAPVVQPKPLPTPLKPSMTMGSTIVWVLKNIFGTLKKLLHL